MKRMTIRRAIVPGIAALALTLTACGGDGGNGGEEGDGKAMHACSTLPSPRRRSPSGTRRADASVPGSRDCHAERYLRARRSPDDDSTRVPARNDR